MNKIQNFNNKNNWNKELKKLFQLKLLNDDEVEHLHRGLKAFNGS